MTMELECELKSLTPEQLKARWPNASEETIANFLGKTWSCPLVDEAEDFEIECPDCSGWFVEEYGSCPYCGWDPEGDDLDYDGEGTLEDDYSEESDADSVCDDSD